MILKIFVFIVLAGVNGFPFDPFDSLFSRSGPTILVSTVYKIRSKLFAATKYVYAKMFFFGQRFLVEKKIFRSKNIFLVRYNDFLAKKYFFFFKNVFSVQF